MQRDEDKLADHFRWLEHQVKLRPWLRWYVTTPSGMDRYGLAANKDTPTSWWHNIGVDL